MINGTPSTTVVTASPIHQFSKLSGTSARATWLVA